MRKNRQKQSGGVYNVETYTLNHAPYLEDEAMKLFIHRLFELTVSKFNCNILASTVTATGLFLVISTELLPSPSDISEIMKFIKSQITIEYNRTHGRRGTIWQTRFKSELLQTKRTISYGIRKVHAHIPVSEEHRSAYEFSTERYYRGNRSCTFLYRFVWKKFERMKLQQGIRIPR